MPFVYVLAFGLGGVVTLGATWLSQYQHRSQVAKNPKPLTADDIAAEVTKRLAQPLPAVNVLVQSPTTAGLANDTEWVKRRADVEARLLSFVRDGEKAHDALYSAQDKQHVDIALQEIEKWRATFGNYCEQHPSLRKRDCKTKILSKTSDRITEPLARIRTMLNEIDRWVD